MRSKIILLAAPLLIAGTAGFSQASANQTSSNPLLTAAASQALALQVNYADQQAAGNLELQLISQNTGETVYDGQTAADGRTLFSASLLSNQDVYTVRVLNQSGLIYENELYLRSNGSLSLPQIQLSQTAPAQTQAAISFTATVQNNQNENVNQADVILYDISNGDYEEVAEKKTDVQGRVTFANADGIQADHNYAIAINGKGMDYTFRSDSDQHFARTFHIDASAEIPHITFTATIKNSQGQAVNQADVVLYDITYGRYDKTDEKRSDAQGRVTFANADGIQSAHSYFIGINGHMTNFTFRSDSDYQFTHDYTIDDPAPASQSNQAASVIKHGRNSLQKLPVQTKAEKSTSPINIQKIVNSPLQQASSLPETGRKDNDTVVFWATVVAAMLTAVSWLTSKFSKHKH